MAIGQHVKKYQDDKAAAARGTDPDPEGPDAAPASDPDPVEAPAPPPEPSMGAAFALMAQLLQEIRGSQSADAKERSVVEAERLLLEQKRLALEQDRASREMRENLRNPEISVYSHPRGNKDDPKPTLKTKYRWVGFEEREETLTPAEIDGLNALPIGDFMVTKADGQRIRFEVRAKYSDVYDPVTNRPKVEEISVWFPCRGDARHNHLSKLSYCQQAATGAIPNHDDLIAEVARLKAELARENQRSVLTPV